MPQLKEKIKQDQKEAMIGKKDSVLSVLRLLSAAILNKEKDKQYKQNIGAEENAKAELTDEETLDIVSSEIKKLRDAVVLFEKGGRADLVGKTQFEISVLTQYLPKQLGDEEVAGLIKEAIKKTGAAGIKDMGKVMAILMPEIRGKADTSRVSATVKEALGKQS
jgi:hypothetical protein